MIYADHAATTKLSPRALEAMMPFLTEEYGNASSLYAPGRRARRAVDKARETVAACVGALPEEIYFTACGTESDNWAIRAAAEANPGDALFVTTAVEHHAVLRTFEALRRSGRRTEILGVDGRGRLSPETLRRTIGGGAEATSRAPAAGRAAFVSVMAANNEVGTLMPLAELAELAHGADALFHTDAVQALGHIPIDVSALGVDMMSFSAHKFGGPKGVGGLYVRKGVPLPPGLYGGGQEHGLRSGTENVAGIVGMAAALEEACGGMQEAAARAAALRDRLIDGVLKLPGARLTGAPVGRLPGTASFVFDGIEGEALVLLLDQQGVCASSGSACSAGALEPSHVLLAMGFSPDEAQGALRFSLGPDNTREEIDEILRILPEVLRKLRNAG